ncbi:MAG TPA: hypothetical protein PKI14_15065 [Fervidobacterium sp.]|nr:hypothetical protein [Fervidobacterium sp.]
MKKELEKLKMLTEKLKNEGDITEDEADWLYMFRRIYKMSYTSYNFVFNSSQYDKYHDILRNFPIEHLPCDKISEEFLKWYEVVKRYIKAGRQGNFLSTVPTNEVLDMGVRLESNVETTLRRITDFLGEAKVPENFSGRVLTGDIEKRIQYVFSRYGLEGRPRAKKKKDINFLTGMTKKLKRQGDITQDEADLIYMLVKYACVIKCAIRADLDELHTALQEWYKAVSEDVKAGRRGNFLYTLPTTDLDIGNSKYYILESLERLPVECDKMIFFGAEPEHDRLFLDSFSAQRLVAPPYPAPYRAEAVSYRWGSMKRAGLDVDRYIKFEDPSKSSYIWIELAGKKLEKEPNFERDGRYRGIIVKLEYLKNHGMIPFGAAIRQGSCFLLFDERTYEKAKPILDISDEKIEK